MGLVFIKIRKYVVLFVVLLKSGDNLRRNSYKVNFDYHFRKKLWYILDYVQESLYIPLNVPLRILNVTRSIMK